jgi:hypothetical protein
MLIAGILGLVSGCATGPTDLDSQAADRLQALVVDVAAAASANDYSGAVKTLDGLQKLLDSAAASGEVSTARYLKIQRSLDQVRADLVAEIPAPTPSAAPSPTPTPSPTPDHVTNPAPSPAPTAERGQQGPNKDKKPHDPGTGKGGDNNK